VKSTPRDAAGASLPPPVTYLIGLVLGIAIGWILPIPLSMGSIGLLIAAVTMTVGGLLLAAAAVTFSRSGTALDPRQATSKIVQSGPYAFSRNPIYLGFAFVYLAFAFAFSSVWAIAFLLPVLMFIDRNQIPREETYLERKFGEEYRSYKSRVRRWL
jgi:protein-S-isoprenylcysteine O-methyltransferase Ste14